MTRITLVLIAALAIAACSSRPTLDPRPGGNPDQIDLSGDWILRSGDELPVNHEQTIRLPPAATRRPQEMQRTRAERRSKRSSVHMFLESGTAVKISQTAYGLFFSFDRAVVEEYNFGERLMVAIGPIEAMRVSGWDGPTFVVDTMDSQGNVLTERWRLDEDTLLRDITIAKGEVVSFSLRQTFDRR